MRLPKHPRRRLTWTPNTGTQARPRIQQSPKRSTFALGDPLSTTPLKEGNGDIVEIAKEWELGERYPVTLLLDSSTIPLDPVEIEAEAQIYLNTDLPRSSKITGHTVTFFKAGEFKEPDVR